MNTNSLPPEIPLKISSDMFSPNFPLLRLNRRVAVIEFNPSLDMNHIRRICTALRPNFPHILGFFLGEEPEHFILTYFVPAKTKDTVLEICKALKRSRIVISYIVSQVKNFPPVPKTAFAFLALPELNLNNQPYPKLTPFDTLLLDFSLVVSKEKVSLSQNLDMFKQFVERLDLGGVVAAKRRTEILDMSQTTFDKWVTVLLRSKILLKTDLPGSFNFSQADVSFGLWLNFPRDHRWGHLIRGLTRNQVIFRAEECKVISSGSGKGKFMFYSLKLPHHNSPLTTPTQIRLWLSYNFAPQEIIFFTDTQPLFGYSDGKFTRLYNPYNKIWRRKLFIPKITISDFDDLMPELSRLRLNSKSYLKSPFVPIPAKSPWIYITPP